MGTIFGLLLFLSLCGFIAYVGDLLGRRLGKKRLSVFGLRPKHTAILLTIVTGVLIAGVTFAAAMASVPAFRGLVIQGERLARENRERQKQNEELAERNRDLTTTNQSLNQHSAELRSKNTLLQKENGGLQSAKEELSKVNAHLQASNAGLAGQNKSLQARNQGLQGQNAELGRKNVELDREIGSLRSTRDRLSGSVRELRAEVQGLNTKVAVLRTEVASLQNEEYIIRRGQRFARRPMPPNPPAELVRETVKLVLWEAERDARAANRKLKPRQPATVLVNAASQAEIVRKALAMRSRPIVFEVVAAENCVNGRTVPVLLECYSNEPVFRKGEEIARRPVDGAASEGLILGDLVLFLQTQVRQAATREGMVPTEEGLGELTYDRLLEVCRQIKQVNGPVVVVAKARQDTSRAGPLNVELEVGAIRQIRAGLR